MTNFDFITDDRFRTSLEKDSEELNKSMDAGAWKAVHVLAGSIIEALLLDHLTVFGYSKKTPEAMLKMELGEIVDACVTEKILSTDASNLSTVIREYRNLIHPGRVIRLGKTVGEQGAKIAQTLVEIISSEVSEHRRQKYGPTSEQIVRKLCNDSYAIGIVEHLLKSANPAELRKLLLHTIPDEYMTMAVFDEDTKQQELSALRIAFRAAFTLASEGVKKEVVCRAISLIREGNGYEITLYMDAFFKVVDMKHLPTDDWAIVKAHLFLRMKREADIAELLPVLGGMGKYLNTNEVSDFIDPFIKAYNTTSVEKTRKAILSYISQEYMQTTSEVDMKIEKRLKIWIEHYKNQGLLLQSSNTSDIMAALSDPFADE